MSAYCSSCGSPIPDGQGSSCSMCYGDVDHGTDGYYREMLEREQRLQDQQDANAAAAFLNYLEEAERGW